MSGVLKVELRTIYFITVRHRSIDPVGLEMCVMQDRLLGSWVYVGADINICGDVTEFQSHAKISRDLCV